MDGSIGVLSATCPGWELPWMPLAPCRFCMCKRFFRSRHTLFLLLGYQWILSWLLLTYSRASFPRLPRPCYHRPDPRYSRYWFLLSLMTYWNFLRVQSDRYFTIRLVDAVFVWVWLYFFWDWVWLYVWLGWLFWCVILVCRLFTFWLGVCFCFFGEMLFCWILLRP